jgi:hypothetical protein
MVFCSNRPRNKYMRAKKKYIFFTIDAILNLAAILKKQNINFNVKLIIISIKNIPQSFSILDLVLYLYDRTNRFTPHCVAGGQADGKKLSTKITDLSIKIRFVHNYNKKIGFFVGKINYFITTGNFHNNKTSTNS